MHKRAQTEIRKPRTDNRRIVDVVNAFYSHNAFLISHKLGLYEFLGHGARTAAEVASQLNLAARPTQALLSTSAALGFVKAEGGKFRLTATGEDYLLKDSPTYGGPYIDFTADTASAWSYANVEKSVLSNSAQGLGGAEWIKMQTEQDSFARQFTHVMHSQGIAPALAWPDKVNLSRHSVMLDIGGGSGAHSIGATLRWKRLKAIVFDIPTVREVAQEYAQKYGLQERIEALSGDMWNDPFPVADVHFYSQIYHDWSDDKCRELTAKSFESLKRGGRIIVHEMLFNSSRTGPIGTAAMEMVMMVFTQGRQFMGKELSAILREAGFRTVQVKPTFGYWSIVTGAKP